MWADMDGIIVVNKPQQFTSFDVVAVMRRLCGQKKIGHTGTLDPMAQGVLPLLLGSATRAQDILPDSDKEYEAEFRLGLTTDTLDIWGDVTAEKPAAASVNDIERLLPSFRGEIMQLPPMFSAVKKNGVRLYDLARQGEVVEREPRRVTISELSLLGFDEKAQTGRLKIACSKGTYIRSLIDDMGRELGCGAVMTSLLRTRACGFTLDDAKTLDEIKALTNGGENSENAQTLLRSTESLFTVYDRVTVSDKQAHRFANGNPLDIGKTSLRSNAQNGAVVRVGDRDGSFIALGRVDTDKGVIAVYKMFALLNK